MLPRDEWIVGKSRAIELCQLFLIAVSKIQVEPGKEPGSGDFRQVSCLLDPLGCCDQILVVRYGRGDEIGKHRIFEDIPPMLIAGRQHLRFLAVLPLGGDRDARQLVFRFQRTSEEGA